LLTAIQADCRFGPARSIGKVIKLFKLAAIVSAAFVFAGGAAQAIPTPAGTLSISYLGIPGVNTTADTVTLGNPFGFFGGPSAGIFSNVSSFAGGMTSSSPPLAFSPTQGGIIDYSGNVSLTPINGLFVFTVSGETYSFNLDQSIQTTNNSGVGTGNTIDLYLLGDLSGTGNVTYDPTQTSVTLAITQNGPGNFSISGTLSNPPVGSGVSAPAPEPASLSLMGAGLAALGFIRRRRRKS
jgi:hypothetical protein